MDINRYGYYFLFYALITFVSTILIINTSGNKNIITSFVILYWFIMMSTFKSIYVWSLIPYYIWLKSADVWLGWFLLILVILLYLTKNEFYKYKKPLSSYEKILYAYLGISILFYVIHGYFLQDINFSKALYFIQIYISAILIFIGVKTLIDKELLRAIMKMTLFMSVLSSIIGIIQFFIDPHFLKFGPIHVAIPGYGRTSGIFRQPFDNGIFVIMGIFLSYFYIKNKQTKLFVILLLSLNLVLTFSRGLWIAFIFVFLYHLSYFYSKKLKRALIYTIIIASIVFVTAGTIIINSSVFQSRAFTERIFQDTVTIRFAYYFKMIKTIPDRWLIGYGDVENNPVYFSNMADLEQSFQWALGKMGGVHNLILEELFLRGIPLTIIFLLYFFALFRFCSRESYKQFNYFYLIPCYYAFAYIIYFQSVSGFLTSTSGFLCVFFTALAAGVYHNNIDISEYSFNFKEKEDKHDTIKIS